MQTRSFAALLLLTLAACSQAPDQAGDAEEVVKIPVETRTVGLDSVSAYYRTTAILEAPEEAEVVARVSGIVEQLLVEEGHKVKAGQLLARIDPKRYQLALNKAQAELDVIDQELNRLKAIANKQLVSQETLSKLSYRRQAALAEREIAALELEYSAVSSPIDGVVAKRIIKRGKMAGEYEPLFHIVQQDTLHGIIHLPERELDRVRTGQQAELELSGRSEPVIAQVLRIAPVVDADTGTFKITLEMENRDGILKAGMFSRARLRFDTHHNALVVPRIALVRQDLGHSVFVVQDGQAHARTIELGYEDGEQVEILGGLDAGDQVVIRGQHQLKDDAMVEVIPPLELAEAR